MPQDPARAVQRISLPSCNCSRCAEPRVFHSAPNYYDSISVQDNLEGRVLFLT